MSTLTTPDNLVVPVGTDGVAPLQTVLANMQNSVQQAFVARGQQAFARYATKTLLPTSGNAVWQHATITADPVAANNGDYQWNGTAWNKLPAKNLDAGYRAGATDTSGRLVVTHSLGVTPSSVQVTGGRQGPVLGYRVYAADSLTATTFTVYVSRSDNGGALASNPVDFYWAAFA